MSANNTEVRSVSRVVDSITTLEGGGFLVHRPFPTEALSDFDPFLLLDQMGPVKLGPGEATGAPDHPHRGFETVTYMLDGLMEHKDSQGNSGRLGPGDVQWMTAGAGVVHSEMPSEELVRDGGPMHGFQLWVNLPRQDKMMAPRYQDVPSARIPVATSDDGSVTVKVIAGEALGATAVIDTRIPIMYLHCTLRPNARVTQRVPREHNVFAYVISGEGRFGPDAKPAGEGQMVIFSSDGDEVVVEAADGSELSFLLLAGAPLHEPVARYGPFVMNTQAEIAQAIQDFRNGWMGLING